MEFTVFFSGKRRSLLHQKTARKTDVRHDDHDVVGNDEQVQITL